MARRQLRRDAQPEPPTLHEYVERAADWVLRYKLTVIVVAAVVICALVVIGLRREEARGDEAQAWERFGQSQGPVELRLALSELEGTTAYPWAALRAATGFYREERFEEARQVLEPVVADPQVDPYPRAYCLYVLGCIAVEEGQPAEAKNYLEKALTCGQESPFLRERAEEILAALADWPPPHWGEQASEASSEDASAGTSAEAPAEGLRWPEGGKSQTTP